MSPSLTSTFVSWFPSIVKKTSLGRFERRPFPFTLVLNGGMSGLRRTVTSNFLIILLTWMYAVEDKAARSERLPSFACRYPAMKSESELSTRNEAEVESRVSCKPRWQGRIALSNR